MDVFAVLIQLASFSIIFLIATKVLLSRVNVGFNKHHSLQSVLGGLKQRFYTSDTQYVFKIFIVTRLTLLIVGYLAYVVLEGKTLGFFSHFQNMWHRWDVDSYLYIAEHGYTTKGDDANRLAFYPLYPMTIRLFNTVVGNYFIAGTILSALYFLGACLVLQRLVKLEFASTSIANNSVKYMLLYPFSFFATTVYTESLFLLLTISCFYFLRQQKWYLAGFCGLLAALTRNQGVLLVIPMCYEMLSYHRQYWMAEKQLSYKRIGVQALALCLVPCGILIYLIVNKVVTGDWFTFLDIQKNNWGQSFGFFATNVKNAFMQILQRDVSFAVGISIPTLAIFFLSSIALLMGIKHLSTSYILYGLVLLLISFSPTWLLSGPRYVFAVFPLFIITALWVDKKPHLEQAVDYILISFLTLYCIMFLRGIVF